jgi:hypothetical protein
MKRSERIRTDVTTMQTHRLLDHAVQLLDIVKFLNSIPGVFAEETIAETTVKLFTEHSDVRIERTDVFIALEYNENLQTSDDILLEVRNKTKLFEDVWFFFFSHKEF